MIMTNVSLMFASYIVEKALRMDFHRHSAALTEATHTQTLLKMLLPERVTAKLKEMSRKAQYVCANCGCQNPDSTSMHKQAGRQSHGRRIVLSVACYRSVSLSPLFAQRMRCARSVRLSRPTVRLPIRTTI
jgi:hypothetical protein